MGKCANYLSVTVTVERLWGSAFARGVVKHLENQVLCARPQACDFMAHATCCCWSGYKCLHNAEVNTLEEHACVGFSSGLLQMFRTPSPIITAKCSLFEVELLTRLCFVFLKCNRPYAMSIIGGKLFTDSYTVSHIVLLHVWTAWQCPNSGFIR